MGSSIEVRGRNDAGEASLRFQLLEALEVGWEREGRSVEKGKRELLLATWELREGE